MYEYKPEYCPFSHGSYCLKYADYRFTLTMLEIVSQKCNNNWEVIQGSLKCVDYLEKLLVDNNIPFEKDCFI